jgi:transcriptional regulator with XRE-family HTH domain
MESDKAKMREERIRDRYRRIGENIAEYRFLKGYTQVQLAEKIGISVNYLSQIERGKREKYSLQVLVMAADALDIPLSALCD